MRFLVDAQLPRRLAYRLREAGHDAVHTLDLPDGNRTTDQRIIAYAVAEDRVIVTKDADFVDALLLRGIPRRLLLITMGNVRNVDLERILLAALPQAVAMLETHRLVELSRDHVRARL